MHLQQAAYNHGPATNRLTCPLVRRAEAVPGQLRVAVGALLVVVLLNHEHIQGEHDRVVDQRLSQQLLWRPDAARLVPIPEQVEKVCDRVDFEISGPDPSAAACGRCRISGGAVLVEVAVLKRNLAQAQRSERGHHKRTKLPFRF